MDELKAFREIKKVAQQHYFTSNDSDKRNHFEKGVEYLTQCQEILYTYFKNNKTLSGKIIYSTLSYIDYREKDKTHTALIANKNFESGYFWNNCIPNFGNEQIAKTDSFFKKFIEDINRNKLISLTNILFERTKFKAPDFIISNCDIDQDDVYNLDIGVPYQEEPLCHFQYHKKKGSFYLQYKSSIKSFIDVYNQEKVSFLNSDYITKVKEYFLRYQQAIDLFNEFGLRKVNFNFIKPFLEGNEYNVLLTVATTENILRSERAMINLFLYKIVSYMATDLKIEKLKHEEEIARLRNVTASTHIIKTTINGLFAPTINSLFQGENVDMRIRELDEAKNKLLNYAEVINLISKLSSDNEGVEEIKKSLVSSKLFTVDSDDIGNLELTLDSIIAVRKRDSSLTEITFLCQKISDLSPKAFVYEQKYYPADSFYELLLLTIIENVVKHGATDDGKLNVTFKISENKISFSNIPKSSSPQNFKPEDMTGNFRVFHTILNKLKLGKFIVTSDGDEFKVVLKTQYYA